LIIGRRVGHPQDQVVAGDAGVVGQDVDPAELLERELVGIRVG